MTSPLERRYISQYAPEVLGLQIHVQGQLADPDGQSVTVTMTNDVDGGTILSRQATRADVGTYEITLSSNESGVPGTYTVTWRYVIAGISESYATGIIVGAADPAYDSLAEPMKMVVDGVWMRFEDLFDSPNGGPNLQTYVQTRFGRGRIAQLLRVAVGRLNTAAQPFQTYTLDNNGGATFPVDRWGPLLEQALYVEALKHLRRSYAEQPQLAGGNVTRLDRTNYSSLWGEILADEQEQLKQQLDVFKIASMGLGRPQVLVSGGVFGRYGPTRYGSMAARPRFWSRAY